MIGLSADPRHCIFVDDRRYVGLNNVSAQLEQRLRIEHRVHIPEMNTDSATVAGLDESPR